MLKNKAIFSILLVLTFSMSFSTVYGSVPITAKSDGTSSDISDFQNSSGSNLVWIDSSGNILMKNNELRIQGSGGSNYAIFATPSLSGNVTITVPSVSSTLATLGANTFTGNQTIGTNSIKTSNYQIQENTILGETTLSFYRASGNNQMNFWFVPSGTSNNVNLNIARKADVTTNYEYLNIASDYGAANEYELYSNKGGSGQYRPIAVYENATKEFSFDVGTPLSVTSYVNFNIGANKIKATDFSFGENASINGLSGYLIQATTPNIGASLAIAPIGTSHNGALKVFRTNDVSTNTQYFEVITDYQVANEIALAEVTSGTGAAIPINFYEQSSSGGTITKIMSIDTGKTITDYVPTNGFTLGNTMTFDTNGATGVNTQTFATSPCVHPTQTVYLTVNLNNGTAYKIPACK